MEEVHGMSIPSLLGEIPDPPKKLYYRGHLPDWDANKFLCVVGSRKYSSYGKEACEKLIGGLAGYPIVIVSGLALGIDSIAHRSAIASGLKTIAVPGSGLDWDSLYPASHRNLAEEIIKKGGALISEFEPSFKATQWGFPKRNRIMAGLCHATFVVEAEIKSGTLITSRLAAEYNRDVFVLPGSIFSPGTAGPHMLLRLGATPVVSSEDILREFGLEDRSISYGRDYSQCSESEKVILASLIEPLTRDDLIRISGLKPSETNTIISVLEIKGLIKESLGQFFRT